MPEGMEIEVETVDLDEQQAADSPMARRKRFLFNGLFKVGIAHSWSNKEIK